MASSHLYLTQLVGRNGAADAQTNKLARFLIQRGGVDNTQVLTTAATGNGTAASYTAVSGLAIDSGVGFNSGQPIVGGRTYKFRMVAPTTVNGSAGMALKFDGGTATFSSFAAIGYAYTAAAVATLAVTAATGLVVNAAAAYTSVVVEGTFTASGSGTFIPNLSVNTTGTAAQLLAGSFLQVTEVMNAQGALT